MKPPTNTDAWIFGFAPLVLCGWFAVATLAQNVEVTTSSEEPSAKQSVPHLEDCTLWLFRDDILVITNNCALPVTIQIMLIRGESIVRGDVKPKESFNTGVSRSDVRGAGSIFTACPAGHVPDVPFLLKNRHILAPGKYTCVKV